MSLPARHPLLVAEVSSNHARDRARALAFVEASAAAGCGAVKFQQFRIRSLFAPAALRAHPELLAREAWELPESFHAELAAAARAAGLEYHCTPFYREAVELLEPHVDRFKLASYQLLWHELLAQVARTEKPVVLATGMATFDEVRAAVDVLGEAGCRELVLLHCVSLYPTPPDAANLRALASLRGALDLPVGWSDHTRSIDVVERAVQVFAAPVVELHLDLDGAGAEYARGHCWLPDEVRALVARLEEARALPASHPADGDGVKAPHPLEQHERGWRTDPADGLRPLLATRRAAGWSEDTGREHAGEVLTEKNGFRVLDCTGCGFRHVDPLPTEAELVDVYRHEYYELEKPLYLERARADLAWWQRVYDERLEACEGALASDTRRFLDVGSGPGFLVERASERGWQALGIEPSRRAAAHARALGVEVIERFLDDALARALAEVHGGFDVVHAAEVLEHLPDPRAMVARCAELLAPGGVLCLSVPNDFNPFQAVLAQSEGMEPWWVAPPHHLNYFDFDSLEALVARAGLVPVRRETSFPIDLFLLMGENYVGDDAVGRRCHGMRMRFEAALERAGRGDLRRALYAAFAGLGLGRHAIVYARKPAA